MLNMQINVGFHSKSSHDAVGLEVSCVFGDNKFVIFLRRNMSRYGAVLYVEMKIAELFTASVKPAVWLFRL